MTRLLDTPWGNEEGYNPPSIDQVEPADVRALIDALGTGTNTVPKGNPLWGYAQRSLARQGNTRAARKEIERLKQILASSPNQFGQSVGYRSSIGRSWIYDGLCELAATRMIAASLTPGTEIILTNNATMLHGYPTVDAIITAARAAMRGDPSKNIMANTGAAAAASVLAGPLNVTEFSVGGANTALTVLGSRAFAFAVTITGSDLNFTYQPIEITMGPPSVAAGVVTIPNPNFKWVLKPSALPQQLVFLSVGQGGGYATVKEGRVGDILGNNDNGADFNIMQVTNMSNANIFATFESINERDLLNRLAPPANQSQDGVWNGINNGARLFTGVRDQG